MSSLSFFTSYFAQQVIPFLTTLRLLNFRSYFQLGCLYVGIQEPVDHLLRDSPWAVESSGPKFQPDNLFDLPYLQLPVKFFLYKFIEQHPETDQAVFHVAFSCSDLLM